MRPTTVKYDGQKDLVPITLLASAPLVLVGKPELPSRTAASVRSEALVQGRHHTFIGLPKAELHLHIEDMISCDSTRNRGPDRKAAYIAEVRAYRGDEQAEAA